MKNIIPKRRSLSISRQMSKAFLEEILDINKIPYLKGKNNLIVPDEAMAYLAKSSSHFKVRDDCIVTGPDPSEKYEGRFEEYHAFSEDDSIFKVFLRDNNNGLMDYLKNKYSIKR